MNPPMKRLTLLIAFLLPLAEPGLASMAKKNGIAPESTSVPIPATSSLPAQQPDTTTITPISNPAVSSPAPTSASSVAVQLPAAEPISRYQSLIDRSPFALASQSAPAPTAPEQPSFAKELVVTGVMRLASGDYYVSIASRDQSQRFALTKGDDYNGISIANIAWSDDMGKTKVTIKRGMEVAVISFDEVSIRGGTSAAPGVPPVGIVPMPMGAPNPNVQPPLPAGLLLPNPNPPNPALTTIVPATPGTTASEAITPDASQPAPPTQVLPGRRRVIRSAP